MNNGKGSQVLANRVAIITGAASGFAERITEVFGPAGYVRARCERREVPQATMRWER